MRILLSFAVLFIAAASLFAEEAKPINILIVTGGHDFDEPNFYKMFDAMPNIRYDKAKLPKDMDLLAPGLEKKYDLVLTYDMNNFPVSNAQREQFAKLIEEGMPLLVLHHSVGGYDNWMPYSRMIGGKYVHKPTEIDGKTYPASDYKHDIDIKVQIADKEHPITKGLDDFVILDETYYTHSADSGSGNNILIKTDHPNSMKSIAWTRTYKGAPIFNFVLGHGKSAYGDKNFQEVLRRGILWAAGEI